VRTVLAVELDPRAPRHERRADSYDDRRHPERWQISLINKLAGGKRPKVEDRPA
jgi:hypothetical protein